MKKDTNLQLCLGCGAGFSCAIAQGEKSCWCFALPPLQQADNKAEHCYCPRCIQNLLKEENSISTKSKIKTFNQ